MEKNKLMMGIVIGLLVLLLGTIVGVAIYLFTLMGNDETEGYRREPGILRREDIQVISLGDIRTNLARGPSNREHMAQVGVNVGIDTTGRSRDLNEFLNTFNTQTVFAQSVVSEVIFRRTYEEVRSPEGRAALAEEIMTALQEAFETNLIVEVTLFPFIVN
jgi:flagellar basal body-associated protein FliL